MSLSLNSPAPRATVTEPPVHEDPAKAKPFPGFSDEQKREYLDKDLQRLQQKPDRTEDENAKMSLIPRFLDGSITSSELEELDKLYAQDVINSNSPNVTQPGTDPQHTRPKPTEEHMI